MTTETERTSLDETTTAEPAPASASLWEDFIEIFFAPSEVFARRRDGHFWLALIVLTVVTSVLFYASQGPLAGVFEGEFRRGIERAAEAGNRMTDEQAAQMRAMSERFAIFGVILAVFVGTLVMGVLVWALSKMFGSVATLAVATAVAVFSQFPKILQGALNIVQGLFLEPDSLAAISFGPARFFDADTTSAALLAMLGRFDLFIIWCTALIAIGLIHAARMERSNAVVVAVLVWLLGAVPTVLPAVLQG